MSNILNFALPSGKSQKRSLTNAGSLRISKYFNDVSITYLHNENQTNDDMLEKRLLGELHAKTGLKRDYFSQAGRKGRLPTQKLQVRQILKGPYGFPLLLSRNASDKNFQQQDKKQNAYNT